VPSERHQATRSNAKPGIDRPGEVEEFDRMGGVRKPG